MLGIILIVIGCCIDSTLLICFGLLLWILDE